MGAGGLGGILASIIKSGKQVAANKAGVLGLVALPTATVLEVRLLIDNLLQIHVL